MWVRGLENLEALTRMKKMKKNVTKNFTREELECHCGCGKSDMNPTLLTKLQALRDIVGPLVLNSAFRCVESNSKIKKYSPKSQHLLGRAVDICTLKMNAQEKHRLIKNAFSMFTGIGVYPTFIHVDVRDGNQAFWVL